VYVFQDKTSTLKTEAADLSETLVTVNKLQYMVSVLRRAHSVETSDLI